MIIYTDDKRFANSCLENEDGWESYNNSHGHLNLIINKIFGKARLWYTKKNSEYKKQCLFIKKYAKCSQFDSLVEQSREHELPDNLFLLAGAGDKFHGYRGREWQSMPGNLHLSLFFAPRRPIKNFQSGFLIMAANSVVQTIERITTLDKRISIKWVNDILIDTKKVGGIIVQTQSMGDLVTGVIIGIGLNIFTIPQIIPDKFVPEVTALIEYEDCNFKRILFELINTINNNYQKLLDYQFEELFSFYKKKLIVLNKTVDVYSDPRSGKPERILTGRITDVGTNLELWIESVKEPVRNGRIAFINPI